MVVRKIILLVVGLLFSVAHGETKVAQFQSVGKTNPGISVNGLFLGRAGNKGATPEAEAPNGFHIQEIEARFTSNIDPYFRGDFVLALHQHHGEDHFAIEPEEAFVETLAIPAFTIRAGKWLTRFGRHNEMHTHQAPFIDIPLTNARILGHHGLAEIGLSAAYLTPLPWYSEIVVQALNGDTDDLFNAPRHDDFAGVLFIKNLWDLSDASTFEVDLSGGRGKNEWGGTTELYNVALTYKYRPIEKSAYSSFLWTAEYLYGFKEGAPSNVSQGGISTWAQYQFAKEYWVQGRFEVLGFPEPDAGTSKKYSALIGYVPTHFSAVRLQYDLIDDASEGESEHRVSLQLNVSLGVHPAHYY